MGAGLLRPQKAADDAKKWAMWGAISIGIIFVLYIIFIVVMVIIGASAGSFTP